MFVASVCHVLQRDAWDNTKKKKNEKNIERQQNDPRRYIEKPFKTLCYSWRVPDGHLLSFSSCIRLVNRLAKPAPFRHRTYTAVHIHLRINSSITSKFVYRMKAEENTKRNNKNKKANAKGMIYQQRTKGHVCKR